MGRSAGMQRLSMDAAAAFIDGCPDAFVAVDPEFNIIAWNPAAERVFGYRADEVIGRPPGYLPDDDEERIRSSLGHGSADMLPGIFTRYRKDGTRIQVHVEREIALRDHEGTLIGYGRFIRPVVNESLRLYQRNLISQDLARAVRHTEVRDVLSRVVVDVLQAERAVVLRPDPDGVLVGTLGIGLPQEDAERLTVRIPEPARTAMGVGSIAQGELLLPQQGRVDSLLIPMGPSIGGWVLALVYGHGVDHPYDIADLARALASEVWEALRRVELVGELETKVEILEATAAVRGTAGLDLEAVVEGVGKAALQALGCQRAAVYLLEQEELVLHRLVAVDGERPKDPPLSSKVADELFARQELVTIQQLEGDASPDEVWSAEAGMFSLISCPLRIGDRVVGVLLAGHTSAAPRGFTRVCRLVADALAKEAALAIENARLFANERATVQRLEELDRLRADYIAGITHDLRTPLTLLLGFVRTLRSMEDRTTAEERREYLEIMERHALRLAGLVGDLLLSARLEAGQLSPDEQRELVLADLVDDSVRALDPDRRARVQTRLDRGAKVSGDASQLDRVVQNLVDNALKYSAGIVEVTVAADGDDVALRVRDEGPGIPDKDLPLLFSRFSRVPANPASGSLARGTGLGLSIVRGIVQAHGGTVDVDRGAAGSGRPGACFVVRLPKV